MPVKKFKPTSAGRRFQTTLDFQELSAEQVRDLMTDGG